MSEYDVSGVQTTRPGAGPTVPPPRRQHWSPTDSSVTQRRSPDSPERRCGQARPGTGRLPPTGPSPPSSPGLLGGRIVVNFRPPATFVAGGQARQVQPGWAQRRSHSLISAVFLSNPKQCEHQAARSSLAARPPAPALAGPGPPAVPTPPRPSGAPRRRIGGPRTPGRAAGSAWLRLAAGAQFALARERVRAPARPAVLRVPPILRHRACPALSRLPVSIFEGFNRRFHPSGPMRGTTASQLGQAWGEG